MHFFHRLSILERATDHECIIIAACQKKHQVWEVFKFNGPLFLREEEKLAVTCTHGSPPPPPSPLPQSIPPLSWVIPPPPPPPSPPDSTALRLRCPCRGVPFEVKGGPWSKIWQRCCHIVMDQSWGKPPPGAYESGIDQQWSRPLSSHPGPLCQDKGTKEKGGGGQLMGQATHTLSYIHCSLSSWWSTDLWMWPEQ